MKKLFFNLFLLATTVTFAQVHINEFDVNANNNEIFIELKSEQSNFLLDGYQILFIKQDEKDQSKNYLYYKINLNEIGVTTFRWTQKLSLHAVSLENEKE